jgi:hypothetical protein
MITLLGGPSRDRARADPHTPDQRSRQKLTYHASTRTTQLYDRRRDEVSLDEVERISI